MKRALLLALLLLVPSVLFAQAPDRDMLLTPDGTLYSIESASHDDFPNAKVDATTFLTLSVQQGSKITRTIVPDSSSAGMHIRPALAYDDESQTLFAFWLHIPNSMSSELLFSSYQNGKWQPSQTTIINGDPYHFRFNLRIGVTHRVSTLQPDGNFVDRAILVVHAVWWEETGQGAQARYAMIAIERGIVTVVEVHDLGEFDDSGAKTVDVDPNFNPEILKHPSIVASSNSVDVTFGDATTHTFKVITLKPVADARIHIPIPRHEPGGPKARSFAAPASFTASWTGRISTIAGGDDKVVLYNVGADQVNYVMYQGGAWSDVKAVSINDKVSADAAVAALSRMVLSQ